MKKLFLTQKFATVDIFFLRNFNLIMKSVAKANERKKKFAPINIQYDIIDIYNR